MNDLIQNIEQWAEARNIINGSTVQKQVFKLAEEVGELFNGHNKNNLDIIKDSVGDCVVVLVNLRKMLDIKETLYDTYLESDYIAEIPTEEFIAEDHLIWILEQLATLAEPYKSDPIDDEPNKEMVNLIFYNLMRYCRAKEIDIVGCTRFAYNQIKDRKGRMVDGIWVKEEDLQND